MNSSTAPGAGERRYRALSIGSAIWRELSSPELPLRVHSVFPSSVNLEVIGTRKHVALSGPSGQVYPHAVALERPGDFRTWRLVPGGRARFAQGSIRMHGREFPVAVDLNGAVRRLSRSLPAIGRFTAACGACAARLAGIQAREQHDLRLDALLRRELRIAKVGETLRQGALALGASAEASARIPDRVAERSALWRSVASLVGLGNGLTPSGDDFLCGFIAAVRARCSEGTEGGGLLQTLCAAVEANLGATSEISASLLRWMILDHWPDPLLDLADAIAANREPEALRALEDLCRLGHSSGADIATGFLFGLMRCPNAALRLGPDGGPLDHRPARPVDLRTDFKP